MNTTPAIRMRPLMVRRLASYGAILVLFTSAAQPARAAFHLWTFQELYTNSSGTLQFIELSTTQSNQQFTGGQVLQVKNVGNTITHSITMPADLPSDSANHTFLVGTAGIPAAGGPAPDYTIPSNFLFPAGGTISIVNGPSATYGAMPTNGSQSLTLPSSATANSPRNFAGATGVVPEPASIVMLGTGAAFLFFALRRRRAA